MSEYDWNKFVKRISIKAAEQDIYQAWMTPAGIEKWFLSKAEFSKTEGALRGKNSQIEAGDHYRWFWFGYPDYVETGQILETNGKDSLTFTFSGGCLVRVEIKSENEEVICELTQTMPQEKPEEKQSYFIECGKGWTFYLTNLKSVLEGGLDLRNKNDNLTNVVNS
jgi:uncharacterized protein YndB with AHSA1/START domain